MTKVRVLRNLKIRRSEVIAVSHFNYRKVKTDKFARTLRYLIDWGFFTNNIIWLFIEQNQPLRVIIEFEKITC